MTEHGGKRPGAGRPRIEQPRNFMLRVRLTDDERAKLAARAKMHGVSMSKVVTDWLARMKVETY